MSRTPEQRARYAAQSKAKAAMAAIAEGRVPGRVGRPPRLSAEEKQASAKRQNQRRCQRAKATRTALRAARAIAEGRTPGKAGQPTPFTPEQQKANRRAWERGHRRNGERRAFEAVASRKRRALKRNAEGSHSKRDIVFIRFAQRDRCAFCAEPLGSARTHVDHFVPLVRGGRNDISNLRLLHETCNVRKGATHPHPADRAVSHGMLGW